MRQVPASLRLWTMLAVVAAGSSFALAVPADGHVVLPPGGQRFLPIDFKLEGAFVHPEGVVEVDAMLDTNEVFVQASSSKSPAQVFVYAYSAYRLNAWSVCVAHDPGQCPPASNPALAKAACPGFGPATEDGKAVWRGEVKTESCLAALLEHLKNARVSARDLRLVLEEEAARALFRNIASAIAKEPSLATAKVSFLGPTLNVSGKATRKALEALLLLAWDRTTGSVSFDADKLEILPAALPAPKIQSFQDFNTMSEHAFDVEIIEVP